MPILALLVIFLSLRAHTTPAFIPCVAQQLSEIALGQCLDKEVIAVDAELDRAYQETLASLPKDQQVLLRNSERAWIRCRDADLVLFESSTRGNHPDLLVEAEKVRIVRERIKLIAVYRS